MSPFISVKRKNKTKQTKAPGVMIWNQVAVLFPNYFSCGFIAFVDSCLHYSIWGCKIALILILSFLLRPSTPPYTFFSLCNNQLPSFFSMFRLSQIWPPGMPSNYFQCPLAWLHFLQPSCPITCNLLNKRKPLVLKNNNNNKVLPFFSFFLFFLCLLLCLFAFLPSSKERLKNPKPNKYIQSQAWPPK